MLIAIPSRSRADKIAATIERLPPSVRPDVRVFVPESQWGRYARNLARFDKVKVVLLPDDFRMAEVRHFMGHWAADQGHDYFLMVDDDVRFETRRGPDTTRTTACTHEDTVLCLEAIERRLDDGRWGMVGLQARQFQNAVPPGAPDEIFRENTRNMCVTGWVTKDFLTVDYRRCVVRSDFDATLQLLRQGRPNLNLCYWQHSQVNNVTGGCADYRTTEVADAAAHRLAELHPGLVRVVEKEYPAQARREKNNMGKRLEVVVNWQKAFGYDLRAVA